MSIILLGIQYSLTIIKIQEIGSEVKYCRIDVILLLLVFLYFEDFLGHLNL